MFSKAWSWQRWKCLETKEVQLEACSPVTVIVPSGLFSWPAPSDQLGMKTKYISRIKLIKWNNINEIYLFIFLGWEKNSGEENFCAITQKIRGIEEPCLLSSDNDLLQTQQVKYWQPILGGRCPRTGRGHCSAWDQAAAGQPDHHLHPTAAARTQGKEPSSSWSSFALQSCSSLVEAGSEDKVIKAERQVIKGD